MSWIIATGNQHKRREIEAILSDSGVDVRKPPAGEQPDIAEDGQTFASNAARKAIGWAAQYDAIALADDSGLEVDALEGAPGVYSSRFASEDADDGDNNTKLQKELSSLPDAPRTARYRCVIAVACSESKIADDALLGRMEFPEDAVGVDDVSDSGCVRVDHDGESYLVVTTNGTLEGMIAEEPKGSNGFGYDPFMRLPDGRHVAELGDDEKNGISHRGEALKALKSLLAESAESA